MTTSGDEMDRVPQLEADNARLRRLLNEAGAPDGLRHGLRDTVAMLRTVLRLSAETAETVEEYAAHMEGRLAAFARVRSTTDAFGEAGLHTLIADELMIHLVREGERASITGPNVRLRPKPAQVMALAVHELASNGIEHGVLGRSHGRVEVAWSLDADAVTLVWKEGSGSEVIEPARRGFGSQVLEQMLPYELGGRTALSFEPDGLRCTICFPLTPNVGRIAHADRGDDETP